MFTYYFALLQTLRFIRELGKFTTLRAITVLGGDSMDEQFGALHGNPDIVVATPGRFLHLCVEMDLKLNTVEYVVFDEADRFVLQVTAVCGDGEPQSSHSQMHYQFSLYVMPIRIPISCVLFEDAQFVSAGYLRWVSGSS